MCIKDLPPRNGFFLSFFLPFFPPHGVFFYFRIGSIYLSIYRVRVLYRLQSWDFFGQVDVIHELFPFLPSLLPSGQSVEKIPYTLE